MGRRVLLSRALAVVRSGAACFSLGALSSSTGRKKPRHRRITENAYSQHGLEVMPRCRGTRPHNRGVRERDLHAPEEQPLASSVLG